jgi:trehalose 6-phosphate synthase
VLSKFTGAARELTEAVQVNPYSIEEFAEALRIAAEMPPEERRQRMQKMQKLVRENNIFRWAGSIISEMTALKKG